MLYLSNQKSKLETLYFLAKSLFRLYSRKDRFFFISNAIQEATKRTDMLATFSTDHFPTFFSLSKPNIFTEGKIQQFLKHQ